MTMTQDDISETVRGVLQAVKLQILINSANEADSDFGALLELLDTAIMSTQVDARQGLSGLVWMASTEHKVH